MKQKLTQQQIQKLVPLQLMLARLSRLRQSELERAILEEVEKNPLLEISDGDASSLKEEDISQTEGRETLFPSAGYRGGGSDEMPDLPQEQHEDFFDRLLIQVRESGISDEEFRIAEEIIGNLDEDGFLSDTPIDNIAYKLSVPVKKAEKVLQHIQRLGPPGIAARDLRECMLLQLEDQQEPFYVREILQRYFGDFADGNFEKIRREMKLSEEEMRYAVKRISRLNPRPAAGHDDFLKQSIIPDILLQEKDGNFYIALNDSGTPSLRMAETYLNMLDRADTDKETWRYLNRRRQDADWFIRAIEQRKQSMLAVAQSIVRRQRDFFSGQREHPAPMVMREVAEDTGLDISTVSRIVNGKYLLSPLGIFKLKYFFSERAGRLDNANKSTRDLKRDLKKLIDEEDKNHPLSDEALQSALKDSGYSIARRTVAKYREMMNIPGSRARKKT
jgi:RNA polymerase sigma-54 factor